MSRDTEKYWAATHESGHAVVTVLSFQDAKWLPAPAPRLPVKYVEITEYAYGQWCGNCCSSNIYNSNWDCYRSEAYRPLMEAQVMIELSGGVAESMYREVPLQDCCAGVDRKKAAVVLADLYFLTNTQYEETPFIERTKAILLEYWPTVQRVADALVEEEWLEGHRVNWIVNHTQFRR